jgi:UDP-N-acetylmuramate--alanine ligase
MAIEAPVHLIGIGGTGMSAIARWLLERGVPVSGSDRRLSPLAQSLRQAGAQVFIDHAAANVSGAGMVVRSSAVPDDNPEVQAARAAGIPVLKRADFLGELTAGQTCIAVAGSHGKTTTTAMIAWVLSVLGQDPSYIIGGVSLNLNANAHAGNGSLFVIEADEYDGMFLGLRPQIAVVTNVEHDHPDCYPTPEDFYQAFLKFVSGLQPEGLLLACGEDPGAARLLQDVGAQGRRTRAYGIRGPQYDDMANNLVLNPHGAFDFDAQLRAAHLPVTLRVPGRHNLLNALAALAVVDHLGLPLTEAAKALGEYQGAGRRFELRGTPRGVAVIDDYAHHPAHIRATLAAARSRYPGRPIWAVWQPHTYSRTRLLLADYAAAFANADHALITEVYAAREPAPADGFSARRVVAAMRHPDARFIPGLGEAADFLLARLQPGDVLLVLSAGDADQISERILSGLSAS